MLVLPLCDKKVCSENAAANMQTFLQNTMNEQNKADRGAYAVFEKLEGTKKCTGCKAVSYWGKECQKKHWKGHKTVCGKSVQDLARSEACRHRQTCRK